MASNATLQHFPPSAPIEEITAALRADGAVIARRGAPTFHIPAAPTDLVNTLGCGDAFAGGFLSGRLDGLDDRASAGTAAGVAARAARSAGSR